MPTLGAVIPSVIGIRILAGLLACKVFVVEIAVLVDVVSRAAVIRPCWRKVGVVLAASVIARIGMAVLIEWLAAAVAHPP